MIKVIKINPPLVLVRNASNWTNELSTFINNNGGTWKTAGATPDLKKQRDNLVEKYRNDEIREALECSNTGKKCVYCESIISAVSHYHIEHFSPKSLYYAKTFEWDNLFIACGICNGDYKGDHDTEKEPIVHPVNDIIENYFTYNLFLIQAATNPLYIEVAQRTIEKCGLQRFDLEEPMSAIYLIFRQKENDFDGHIKEYKQYSQNKKRLEKAEKFLHKLEGIKSIWSNDSKPYVGLIRYLFRNSPTFQQAISCINNHQTDLGLTSPFVLF